ncbi:GNAT family N-acetyltransferase [Ktedonosporobacter rubrisoli]|uniref:GNAT family N-acetyltransferase n=1 Tax=Ktedonosporobacter rubrisoli TaxID=2509675 RepID=A0A4P6JUP1_KTERU|nr:GNAT family N-acetyltransferase [Ktedonosporobacter rubrisoli]QBD79359.1 GNAT family N-acetyltransferase [Ktedonosporobacter rubrisoli]
MEIIDLVPGDKRLPDVHPLLEDLDGVSLEDLHTIYAEGYPQGLRLTALYDEGRCMAVAGWRIMATLQWTRKLHIEDLVTLSDTRSRGYGRLLLEELEKRARVAECTMVDLDSGVQRFDAHRFYLRQRFAITKHHFSKTLPSA